MKLKTVIKRLEGLFRHLADNDVSTGEEDRALWQAITYLKRVERLSETVRLLFP